MKLAIRNNAAKCIEVLLKHQNALRTAIVYESTVFRYDSILMYALRDCKYDKFTPEKIKFITSLIDYGFAVDIAKINNEPKSLYSVDINLVGQTALHLAVAAQQVEIVKKLLEHGASPYATMGPTKITPIAMAARDNSAAGKAMQQLLMTNANTPSDLLVQLAEASPLLKDMLAMPLATTPSIDLFSHINTGYRMLNTRLEGRTFAETSQYLFDVFKNMQATMAKHFITAEGPKEIDFAKLVAELQVINELSIEIATVREQMLSRYTSRNIPDTPEERSKIAQKNAAQSQQHQEM